MGQGASAKSYMRKGFLIYEEIRKYLFIDEEAVGYMTFAPDPVRISLYRRKFPFFFISAYLSLESHTEYKYSSCRLLHVDMQTCRHLFIAKICNSKNNFFFLSLHSCSITVFLSQTRFFCFRVPLTFHTLHCTNTSAEPEFFIFADFRLVLQLSLK